MKHTKRLLALLLALALAFALAMPALAAAEVQAQPPGLLNSVMQKLFGPVFGIGGMKFPPFVSSYFAKLDDLYNLFPGSLLERLNTGAFAQSAIYTVLMSFPLVLTVTFWFLPTVFYSLFN